MLKILVNTTDRSENIEWSSLQKMDVLTKEPDRLEFRIKNYGAKTYRPALGEEVALIDNGPEGDDYLFRGVIVETKETHDGLVKYFHVIAKDWTQIMDRKTVNKSYKNQSITAIVQDIVATYLPAGFTTNNVAAPTVIAEIKFNDLIPSKCFQKLADMAGDYDWFVDDNKDIHFFREYNVSAPFNLDDTSGNYIFNSLSINRNISQLRNVIIVKGGTTESATLTDTKSADGQQRTFVAKPSLQTLTVDKSTDNGANWSVLTIGQDGKDDPTTKDVLYNPDNGFIIFRTDNRPASGNLVRWSGKQVYPIKVIRKDWASITKYGEYEYVIRDENIKSADQAKQRALGEIKKYAENINEGTFRTTKKGLRSGQRITIQSDALGLNESFKINRLTLRARTPDSFEYEASLIASETMGIIDTLGKLLVTDPADSEQPIENELIVQVDGFVENVYLEDNFTTTTYPRPTPTITERVTITESWRVDPWNKNVIPLWVAGAYYPTGLSDRKRQTRTNVGAKAS